MSQDVAGFCPMGCGQTLSLMAEGHVTCRKAGCPQPDAASRILHDPEAGHIVVLGEEAFTVLHPLRERLDDALMDCGLHADLERWGPPLPPGRWRVPIEAPQTAPGTGSASMTDKCRGYLVTAPVEARMDLWAATAMFTNWLEGRGPEERMTWHVMCYDSGAEKFLSAARTLGLTVERIDGAGDSEQYVLLAGEPGSGWQR